MSALRRQLSKALSFAVITAVMTGLSLVTPGTAQADQTEDAVTQRLNSARQQAGLRSLTVAGDLVAVARQHSQRMASQNNLYHNPDLPKQVTNWQSLGENVGYGGSVASLHDAFMASPSHRANILSSTYTEVGVGAVWSGSRLWVTQVFRKPITATPAPTPPPAPAGSDLFVTMPNGTTSGRVEVHGLSRGSDYRQFGVHAATAFGAVDPSQWSFQIGSYAGSGRPDLIGVRHAGGSSGRVEVHVLSAASGYRSFVLHAATPLPAVNSRDWQFVVGSLGGDRRSNLFAIKSGSTGSGRTEVHALGEVGGYRYWVLHSATALPPVPAGGWTFLVGDAAGRGDLVGVQRTGTTSGRTEVHTLSRDSGYSSFALHAATPLGQTPGGQYGYVLGDLEGDGRPDLFAVKRSQTGSGATEAHVLSAGSGFKQWALNAATGLHPVADTVTFGAR